MYFLFIVENPYIAIYYCSLTAIYCNNIAIYWQYIVGNILKGVGNILLYVGNILYEQYDCWTLDSEQARKRPEEGRNHVLTQQNERNRWNSLCTRFPFYWGVLKCHSYITIYCITRISKLSFFCIIIHWILSRILLHFDIRYFGEFCRCINSQFLLHCVEFC